MKKLEDYLYYEEQGPPNIKIYHGDCLEIMPLLPKVDLVVTDPPYGMNYNTNSTRFKSPRGGNKANWGGIIGDDKPFDPIPFLDFKEVILWGSNHYSQKLPVGTTLVWIKRKEDAFGTFLSDAEIAWKKGGYGVYCHSGSYPQAIARNRVHPSQKPVALMKWCIQQSKYWDIPSVILDPFMGSGTTLVACQELGRNGIGIEINEKYCAIAKSRLKNTQVPFL